MLAACNGSSEIAELSSTTISATELPLTSKPTKAEAEPGNEDVTSVATAETVEEVTEAEETEAERSFAGTVPAPDFPAGLDWLNTQTPLSLADLRGKVVLLDFWTYGCINCIHIIPDLKKLEEKYAEELVVIGVHSAKFDNESETENIRQVILRYELEHPVVNDNEFQIWTQYGARAWPTLVLIDPDGNVLGSHSGEGIYEPFDAVISGMIEEFDSLGRIDRTPLDLKRENANQVDSPLLFPGKVLADPISGRLFIADSNHNRIVISDLEGNVLEVIGDGRAQLNDGDFESASFFRPQGMTLTEEDKLYIADTENNAIREVDLANRTVKTVAGTGKLEYMRFPASDAARTPLNSPWDVLYHDGRIFIAMAGQHQIWVLDPDEGLISLFAGSGREELKDGSLTSGGLNQPSGLASDGQVLYFADSEASAIRTADFLPDGKLETIVGIGLFDFGDIDGVGDEVRLQHPLGIEYLDGQLYVADTYNNKIKRIDPETRESISFLGGSDAAWQDGADALFNEPGGLSVAGEKLYIADTNNHVIRVADLNTREVETLVLIDMDGLLTRQPAGQEYSGKEILLDPQEVIEGQGQIVLDITIPDGYKVNDLAPFSMEWTSIGDVLRLDSALADQRIVAPSFPLTIPADFSAGETVLTGDLVIYYCEEETQSLCLIERVRLQVPVTVIDEGPENELLIKHEIPDPDNLLGN
jgi:thiol-disulfide isomerase/thioredoxin